MAVRASTFPSLCRTGIALTAITLGLWLVAAVSACGQESRAVEARPDAEQTPSGRPSGPTGPVFAPRAEYAARISAEHAGGDRGGSTVHDVGARLNLITPLSSEVRLSTGLTLGYRRFGFTGDPGLRLDDGRLVDITHGYSIGLAASLIVTLDEQWTLFVASRLTFSLQDRARLLDSGTLRGMALASVRLAPGFVLSFGAGASSDRDGAGLPVIPFVGFEWTPTDDVKLGVRGPAFEASLRLPPAMSFGPREVRPLFVVLDLAFHGTRYRLRQHGTIPGGELTDRGLSVGVAIRFEPFRALRIQLRAGFEVFGEWLIESGNGRDLDVVGRKPALLVALTLQIPIR